MIANKTKKNFLDSATKSQILRLQNGNMELWLKWGQCKSYTMRRWSLKGAFHVYEKIQVFVGESVALCPCFISCPARLSVTLQASARTRARCWEWIPGERWVAVGWSCRLVTRVDAATCAVPCHSLYRRVSLCFLTVTKRKCRIFFSSVSGTSLEQTQSVTLSLRELEVEPGKGEPSDRDF